MNIYVPTFRLRDVSVLDIVNSYTKKNSVSVRILENKIRSAIRREVDKFTQNKVCVALSPGVDSNLILCLLREEYPGLELSVSTSVLMKRTRHLKPRILQNRKVQVSSKSTWKIPYVTCLR